MKLKNEDDFLRGENWAEVYSDMPSCVENGMNVAFNRIRVRRAQARKWRSVAACAACAVLMLGVGIWAIQPGENAPDRIADPHIQAPATGEPEGKLIIDAESAVYASKEDAVFHIRRDCSAAPEGLVELPLITAQEFEKTPCEHCGANVEFITE